MKVQLVMIPAAEWAGMATAAHLAVFNALMPPEFDRIDYALLAVDPELDAPAAYATARELDAESVYLKHGGALPPLGRSFSTAGVYRQMIAWFKVRYKRITTYVENDNTNYLKLALSVGFKPVGIRNFKGVILVELLLED